MSKASNYLEDMVLNYIFKGQSISQPTQLYIALYRTNPTDSDTGSEVVGTGYTRQLITFNNPTQNTDRATISNSARVEFPTAQSEWGEISYYGIRTARDGGNLLVYGAFNKPITISTGNKFIIDTGNLTISVG
ncbi:MAG: hypothetical protein SOR77_00755 [Peptoniphilus sp.]|uniref:phage tail fiber protein n=1 Tax=Peptoniphilus sp. TaxID=1971214 RepID=UPI002A758DA2|nr:hypothetical protein [Peptoniphilus sp.]MDY2986139.1 hypothetical protein [Peptoniphilus sp.]